MPEGNEEICAGTLESSVLPPNAGLNQITPEEETKPGQRKTSSPFCTSADIKKKKHEKHENRSIELVSKHSHVITYVVINQMSLPCVSFPVILLEPVNENLHISSHNDNEDEEVMGLDDMQHMRDAQEEKEEGGTRGEDWEEVRFSANIYIM